jgi:hypothetical protein
MLAIEAYTSTPQYLWLQSGMKASTAAKHQMIFS